MTSDQSEIESLRRQLAEATATLDAIRSGGVDAVVVSDGQTDEVYTLQSSDLPYWTFLEQMAEGALSLNQAHEVLYCNQFLCDLIGLPRESIVGGSILKWLDDASTDAFQAASSDTKRSAIAATMLAADRKPVPVLMSVVPAHGKARRCNVLVSDQRTHHHLRQVTKAHDAAKAESHAKDRFLAVLGHELRNPLAALANSIAVLEEVVLPSERRQTVYSGMARQIHQLNSLVDDLLDLTRVVQGKVVLKRQLVALDEVVADAVASVRATVEQKGQELLTHTVPKGILVDADRVRLEQVLINLLANAARYTPNGGTITVTASRNDDTIEVSVSDTGIGIEADQLERIFEPFAQVGDEGKGGLGIGLSLVRQLIQLHDGTVIASSPGLGFGTTVKVTLPNVQRAELNGSPKVASPPRNKTEQPMRVLIVDDNDDAAEMLGLILSTLGHQTQSVGCGRDVPAAVEAFNPELVLLDLGLPDISGYAVAQQLRESGHKDLLIVALTGFSHESARARTVEAGINAHLIKPVTVDQILSTVRSFRSARNGSVEPV